MGQTSTFLRLVKPPAKPLTDMIDQHNNIIQIAFSFPNGIEMRYICIFIHHSFSVGHTRMGFNRGQHNEPNGTDVHSKVGQGNNNDRVH